MPQERYRIYDYGTIYLTQTQRQAVSLVIGVEVLNARLPYFESGKRLPPQGVWAYVCRRWRDFVDGPELEIRFRKQRHVLWSDGTTLSDANLCGQFAVSDLAILTELAKKPNTPPLPPSTPPTQPLLGRSPRTLIERPGSISIKSTYESDMDIYIWWDGLPDDGSGPCKPAPTPDPPTPPVAPALPAQSGAWNGPQAELVPQLPTGAPPIGGGSLVQGTPFPGDQAVPPSNVTQTFLRLQRSISAAAPPCIDPPPQIEEFGPFSGILPASALVITQNPGWGQSGFPCGATRYAFDISGPSGIIIAGDVYNGYAPPVSLTPRYD